MLGEPKRLESVPLLDFQFTNTRYKIKSSIKEYQTQRCTIFPVFQHFRARANIIGILLTIPINAVKQKKLYFERILKSLPITFLAIFSDYIAINM